MRIADGINAELSQLGQPAFPNRKRHRRAERTAVVMQAHALDLKIAAIHPKAGVRVEVKFADTERDRLLVDRLTTRTNACHRLVQNAFSDVPQLRIFDL